VAGHKKNKNSIRSAKAAHLREILIINHDTKHAFYTKHFLMPRVAPKSKPNINYVEYFLEITCYIKLIFNGWHIALGILLHFERMPCI
jgi:hypothetical protein